MWGYKMEGFVFGMIEIFESGIGVVKMYYVEMKWNFYLVFVIYLFIYLVD